MEKCITVDKLIKQLEILKNLGYGEAEVWFRGWDTDYEITSGIWDNSEDENGNKTIWLG